jgi:hypothetical protein
VAALVAQPLSETLAKPLAFWGSRASSGNRKPRLSGAF